MEDRRRRARAVADELRRLSPVVEASTVVGYMAKDKELDIQGLLQGWVDAKRVCLPRITGPGEMEFVVVEAFDALERGAFGIMEPRGTEVVDASEVECFLVPGLCFDQRGVRVGFGGGYYDRALSGTSGVRVGVCFWEQIMEQGLPREPHDCTMDWVVSGRGAIGVGGALSSPSTEGA